MYPVDPLEAVLKEMRIRGTVIRKTEGRRLTRYIVRTPLDGQDRNRLLRSSDVIAQAFMVPGVSISSAPESGGIAVDVPREFSGEPLRLSDLSGDGDGILIGESVEGESLGIDLWKLPHLLIAGTTGSGKSVCLKSIVSQLECPCLIIDPKGTEFRQGISLPGKALAAVKSLEAEMELRYQQMRVKGVTDWFGERIVCVIDELENIMSQQPALADPLIRIAQKSRAAGIHLLIATQRPARKEIPSQLVANIPGRIAFRVSDAVDSRTILDRSGAEQLLGNGDGYYLVNGHLIRFQGAMSDAPDPIIWQPVMNSCGDSELSEKARQAVDFMHAEGWTECSGSALDAALHWRKGTGSEVIIELEESGYVGDVKSNKKRNVLK